MRSDQPQVLSLRIPNLSVEGRNQVYVLPAEPVTMIDTGIATDRAFEAIVEGLSEHGISVGDVRRIVLTHKHIDHIGNAWRIAEQSGAEILIHESELHAVTDVDPDGHRFASLVQQRLADWNVPDDALPPQNAQSRQKWAIRSAHATGIADGARIEAGGGELEVIHTPGHTMGSICLKFGRTLFSGDHVLPDVSPNVGGGDMRNRNLLRHYLASLDRIVDAARDVDCIMPGHGQPFADLRQRRDELVEHHRQRLNRVLESLDGGAPRTVYEVACDVFGALENYHVVLGCAEAAAHLEYLQQQGLVMPEGTAFQRATSV